MQRPSCVCRSRATKSLPSDCVRYDVARRVEQRAVHAGRRPRHASALRPSTSPEAPCSCSRNSITLPGWPISAAQGLGTAHLLHARILANETGPLPAVGGCSLVMWSGPRVSQSAPCCSTWSASPRLLSPPRQSDSGRGHARVLRCRALDGEDAPRWADPTACAKCDDRLSGQSSRSGEPAGQAAPL